MAEGWKVIKQRETSVNVGNAYVKGMEVTFKTDDGTIGTVTLTKPDYTPDKVHEAIQEQVDKITAVGTL